MFACLLILLSLSYHSKHYLINQTSALIEHFASGANERRIRQALSHRRQHGKEPVADYSFSIRSLCSRLNLPRSEWIHYFVQGLKPEIREYMILQQPVSFEAAENFAKLKESVLSSVNKPPVFDAKQMAPQVAQEPISVGTPGDQVVNALGQQNSSFDNTGSIRQVIKEEIQQAMLSAAPGLRKFPQHKNPGF